MNHPELGRWLETAWKVKETHIANPSATVLFGDSGQIQNTTEKNPDKWFVQKGYKGSTLYFAHRTMNRGTRRCLSVCITATREWRTQRHVDGHVVAVKASCIGFQYRLGHPLAYWDRY